MTSLDIEFEKAVRLLVEHMPPSEEESRKPILVHDIRVAMMLSQRGYARDIVLAGLLHDALEWSDMTEEMIQTHFGETVLSIVQANSKNRTIKDSAERIDDMMRRCAMVGEAALIVKAADTIDSFEHYTKTENKKELEHHCKLNAEAILRQKPESFHDPIFDELRSWLK